MQALPKERAVTDGSCGWIDWRHQSNLWRKMSWHMLDVSTKREALTANSMHPILRKKSTSQCAFPDLHLQIGLFVFVGGVVLATFADAGAQPRSAKSARNVVQRQNVQASIQRPAQNFWAQTNGPQGGDGIALATNTSGHVFVCTQGGGLFRSTDNGETWTEVNNGS
jgi:hypothetical protein